MTAHARLKARQPRLMDIPGTYGSGHVLYLDASNGHHLISDGGNRILWVCPKCKGPQWISLAVSFHSTDWYGGRECCLVNLQRSRDQMGTLGVQGIGSHSDVVRQAAPPGVKTEGAPE